MPNHWLGVVSREHVRSAVEQGFAQANHGKRAPVERMRPGDGLVYYSPREGIRDGAVLKAFTAVGRIDDGDPWQAGEGSFEPWRRSVTYRVDARDVPIDELRDDLELTSVPNWGIVLRRGLIPLSAHDFEVIATAMEGDASA